MVAAACCMVSLPAWAGRPLTTDDATILGDKSCQVQSWMQRNASQTEYWLLPACNFSGNLEWTVGSVRTVGSGRARNQAVVQGKTIFKPLEANGWGLGLAVGSQFDSDRAEDGNFFVNLPLSFSFHDDRVLLHLNAGWLHKNATGDDVATWGVASEWQWNARTGLSVETFRQDVGKPYYQFSVRHQLTERLQIDASYGHRFDGSEQGRFVSIGIVLVADKIIP